MFALILFGLALVLLGLPLVLLLLALVGVLAIVLSALIGGYLPGDLRTHLPELTQLAESASGSGP